MTSGESCVLALSKEGSDEDDVVNEWRRDLGATDSSAQDPESFRSQYATNKILNAIHGSDTHEAAMRYVITRLVNLNWISIYVYFCVVV